MTIADLITKARSFFSAPEAAAEHVLQAIVADASSVLPAFADVERLAKAVEPKLVQIDHSIASIIHTAEKEFEMIPQAFADLLTRVQAALAAHSDQSAALQAQVNDLTTQVQAKDGQIASLTQQLADANGQIADMEAALAATFSNAPVAPTPAPAADGSTSADVTP